MDSPKSENPTIQTEDESAADLPMALRDDLDGLHIYEEIPGKPFEERHDFPGPRIRFPSDCLQDRVPPPLPSRTRIPLTETHKQFSCDFTKLQYKYCRSTTELEVSM